MSIELPRFHRSFHRGKFDPVIVIGNPILPGDVDASPVDRFVFSKTGLTIRNRPGLAIERWMKIDPAWRGVGNCLQERIICEARDFS